MQALASACLSSLRPGVKEQEEDHQQLALEEVVASDGTEDSDVEDEEVEVEEDEHDTFMSQFLQSSHCTLCLYLSVSLVLVGCAVSLIVIVCQVGAIEQIFFLILMFMYKCVCMITNCDEVCKSMV